VRGFPRRLFWSAPGSPEIAAPLQVAIERGLVLSTAEGCRASELGLRFLNETLLLFMAETGQMTGNSALSIARHEPPPGNSGALFTGAGGPIAE
jgi:hypothetical protein